MKLDTYQVRAAQAETLRRYPEAATGMAFFVTAAGLNTAPTTEEMMAWAEKAVDAKR